MMIHVSLRFHGDSDSTLCTMAMDHAVHLHNHTPHISIGLYPDKFGQGPSPPIVPYRMIIHGDALHMSWNQY